MVNKLDDENLEFSDRDEDRTYVLGHFLSHPPEGEEVVITGMTGKFSNSDDVYHLRDNLLNKLDLITEDERRWTPTMPDVAQRTGKINDISSFDAGFFGIRHNQANTMDIYVRMMLERAYEAITDAGFHPSELAGTNTGVFTGVCFSEGESHIIFNKLVANSDTILGTSRSFIAQQVSYYFRLQGPSYSTDTACSSSMYALEHAYRNIRLGKCDMAIVGGVNVCLLESFTSQFSRLGAISRDGLCKSFDERADGYVRAESISAIFLQKSKDARRIYANIVHCKVNSDGHKEQGITYPSAEMQTVMLEETYNECKINYSDVSYFEAHGTGTKAGDMVELGVISDVFCSRREKPLLIGSVKSNVGHSEAAASLSGIIKTLVGMECGYILPNVNFLKPRECIKALSNGQLKVVTETTPWSNNNAVIVGISSFGFGGSNGHVVLRRNQNTKKNVDVGLPLLVCISGRTKKMVNAILKDLSGRPLDVEYVNLLNRVFQKGHPNHLFRGYQIICPNDEQRISFISEVPDEKPGIAWVFNNFGSNLGKFGNQLMTFPVFRVIFDRINNILIKDFAIDLVEVFENFKPDNIMHQILSTMAVQICLVTTLKQLGISLDFFAGLGSGELIAAYFDDFLTLKEVVYAHVYINYALSENKDNGNREKGFLNNFRKIISNKRKLDVIKKWLPLCKRKHQLYEQGSPEYFAKGLAEPVDLREVKNLALRNHVILIVDVETENHDNQYLIKNKFENPIIDFLTTLGSFYLKGHDLFLNHLNPKTSWPVSRGTPMISPLLKWKHEAKWYVPSKKSRKQIRKLTHDFHINLKDKDWQFLSDHVIDGRNLFPATGYLLFVWETLAMIKNKTSESMKIIFEDIKYLRAINLTNRDNVDLTVSIQEGDNTFEISESDAAVVTGTVYEVADVKKEIACVPKTDRKDFKETDVLNHTEIYKELRLRGYDYKGTFKAIECVFSPQKALIRWVGNWVTLLDNMLQMFILHVDTRNLYVPTGIASIIIDPKPLTSNIQEGSDVLIPIHIYHSLGIIRTDGVEIKGLRTNSILKKKHEIPVLESYKFIPYKAALPMDQSIRVITQIILENNLTNIIKIVEMNETKEETELVSFYVNKVLKDFPLVKAQIKVLSKNTTNLPGVIFENKKLDISETAHLVILQKGFENNEILEKALTIVKNSNGYVLTRERSYSNTSDKIPTKFDIICTYTTPSETLFLLCPISDYTQPKAISITDNFDWLPTAQEIVQRGQQLLLYSQNDFTDGILGLLTCLRREPNGARVSCFFIADGAPTFDPKLSFYEAQLRKNLAFNVWKNNEWGSYRHLLIDENQNTSCEHCYANVTVRGDLSSIKFIEGNLNNSYQPDPRLQLIYVYWAALNFRDIMTATERISSGKKRIEQDNVQGIEYSGRDVNGNRVMGIANSGALATHVVVDSDLVWRIPDHWSMEDAATVPIVYSTLVYALITRVNIKFGQSILIHSGTGGVGQAAINIALHFGCDIFVTVGTQEKKKYLLEEFPQINENHIGNSHDTSFEQMVLLQTQGRGVDIVLNSLAEEKLIASVRCVARNGHFVEIGKFDLERDSNLQTYLYGKGITFHGVMLDTLFTIKEEEKPKVKRLIMDLISKGAIQPLPRKVFKKEEVADSFKFIASGKHVGKVLVNIREEEKERICLTKRETFMGLPKFYCNPKGTYVVLGGLGGFGLQLVDWLILRGARKLVLNSRRGISTGYQTMMIRLWQSYGAEVVVRSDDATKRDGCVALITFANSLGPVKGVFNLAVVLKDSLFENQTVKDFEVSLAPKATATRHLDTITRTMCPELNQFVVFSSLSCGRGNAGQTNYGMANSIMERICEQRKADGYPALAIQWGAVGDMGLVADMQQAADSEVVIGGTLPQKMASCLQVLDIFLRQHEAVVSSMVVAEKSDTSASASNIVDAVLNILGIADRKNINIHSTLPDLGMDSIMGIEIKQTLERDFEVYFSMQDFRAMTYEKLQELDKKKKDDPNALQSVQEEGNFLKILLQNFGDEASSKEPFICMNDVLEDRKSIYFLPGFEGTAIAMKPVANNINANAICLQYNPNNIFHTIEEWAESLFPFVDAQHKNFVLVAHSFGCVVATELTHMLENTGRLGKLVLIDGALEAFKRLLRNQIATETEELLETSLISMYMSKYLPIDKIHKHKAELLSCKTLKDRIQLTVEMLPTLESKEYAVEMCAQCCRRIKAIINYSPNFPKLKSEVMLIKPSTPLVADVANDYELSTMFENVMEVKTVEGNHSSILENPAVTDAINKFINDC